MAEEASEARSFGRGGIYIGAAMATLPVNIGAGINPSVFANFGYTDEKGPEFSFGREKKKIMAWQSRDPIRSIITGIPKTITFTLEQMNRQTIRLAMGGGEWTQDASGMFHFDPPDIDDGDERSLIVEGIDGDFTYRFCFPRVELANEIKFSFVNDALTTFPIEMEVLQPTDGSRPFKIQTNDTNVSPTGVAS